MENYTSSYRSNGIHLNMIEAATDPAHESWRNIQAINDLVRDIITTDSHLLISALQGNAAAGGVILLSAIPRHRPEDIMQGAIGAIAGRAVPLMKRVGLEKDFALAGGMTQNAAMVAAIETRLGAPLNLPPQGLGQLNGAFGAALLGLRRVERLLSEGRGIPAPGSDIAAEHGIHTSRRWSTFVSATKERITSANGTGAGASVTCERSRFSA